ncbi:NAD(P)HX epimerase / NAD(P)HX dehydratase [Escherichia coli ISC7]|uniref:NAD(P)HX epimerase / NAD(P)HX dehydratase n=1 Tax=Escherichia coli ISC7 TaxID=1432555 RepID=W1EZ02_ECOLX|nr:NAD(P)HX epimerase / NAD(P)HX dehydratase [Escherichia coli ISC7]
MVAAHPDALGIIDAGNAGMASGGMGDVLSGIIGALLGQKLSPYDAACAGCVAHGAAADVLAARFWNARDAGNRSLFHATAYC